MKDFTRALTACAVAYGVPLAPERIEVYWQILGNYPEHGLVAAIAQYMRLPTSRWFPVPADLIAVMEGETGDDEAAGEVVFGSIARVSSDSHAVALITDADPAAAVALQALGGWYVFSNSDERPQYQRRTFARAYAHARKQERLGLATGERPQLARRIGQPEQIGPATIRTGALGEQP
ncbi:MAG: hypothetical protein ABFE13_11460 [Phycisphaerales bacterium]